MKLDKSLWKPHWEKIRNRSGDNFSHHRQCQELCFNYDFDTFLDIGPGLVGSEAWSIQVLRPECKIIGFEPQTERYELLKSANYPGDLYNKAVAATSGSITGFMGFEGGKSDFWLRADEFYVTEGAYKKCVVDTITIDDIIKQEKLKKVFIWADIEGSELDMLKGAISSLTDETIVGLNLELNFIPDSSLHCNAPDTLNFLRKHGFVNYSPLCNDGRTHADCFFGRKR